MARTAGCACERGAGPLFQRNISSVMAGLVPAMTLKGCAKHARNAMNIHDTAKSAYAIGQPVKRKEDSKLLRGQGRYTDDVNLPGQAYAFILRSTLAHGRIKSINTETAKTMKGVLGIYTGSDVTSYGTL